MDSRVKDIHVPWNDEVDGWVFAKVQDEVDVERMGDEGSCQSIQGPTQPYKTRAMTRT